MVRLAVLERRVDRALFQGIGCPITPRMVHYLVQRQADEFLGLVAEHLRPGQVAEDYLPLQIQAADPLSRRFQDSLVPLAEPRELLLDALELRDVFAGDQHDRPAVGHRYGAARVLDPHHAAVLADLAELILEELPGSFQAPFQMAHDGFPVLFAVDAEYGLAGEILEIIAKLFSAKAVDQQYRPLLIDDEVHRRAVLVERPVPRFPKIRRCRRSLLRQPAHPS